MEKNSLEKMLLRAILHLLKPIELTQMVIFSLLELQGILMKTWLRQLKLQLWR